jgi:hypothetical protein
MQIDEGGALEQWTQPSLVPDLERLDAPEQLGREDRQR